MTERADLDVVVVSYTPRHAEAWRTLNEAWIRSFFSLEDNDRAMLDRPNETVLDQGGYIFVAERGGEPIGCAALIAMDDGGFKLAKMAVDESARGSGVGKLILQKCIEAAKALGAQRLYLETNDVLASAVGLYRSAGFKALPAKAEADGRRNLWMEMKF